jgi:hypothetical protein
MKKIGKMLPCRESPTKPEQARATTNNLCYTNTGSNQYLSTKTIKIGNLLIRIPCFLLFHEEEFIVLASQVGYINAVKLLAIKYNVNIATPIHNVKRYKYDSTGYTPTYRTIQFTGSFILDEIAANTQSITAENDNWSVLHNDARYISVYNDDTKTISTTFTEMKTNATFWVSKLPEFESPVYYAVINSSKNPSNAQSGCLLLQGDRIIFVPVILNDVFLLYQPYSEKTPINLLFVSSQNVLAEKIQDLYDTVKVSCNTRSRYPRSRPSE